MKYLFTILLLLSSFGFALDPAPVPTFEEWGDGMDELKEVMKEYDCEMMGEYSYDLMMMRQRGESMSSVLKKSRSLSKETAKRLNERYKKEYKNKWGFDPSGESPFSVEFVDAKIKQYKGIVSIIYDTSKKFSPSFQKDDAEEIRDEVFEICLG